MDIENFSYNPTQERICAVLRNKMQNKHNDHYHRVLVSWFFAQMATNMHCEIVTQDRGSLPVNMYATLLGVSGLGKTKSMNIMEDEVVVDFKDKFIDETFPTVAETSLMKEATQTAVNTGEEYDLVEAKLIKEFVACGEFPYSFDSGTAAAFKQLRSKAQIAKIGALSLVVDEIGSNILNNTELFNVYLEAYDKGKLKPKITKNTAESTRGKDRTYPTPANLMLFGTPVKLFDGGKIEQEYTSLQETGYARRSTFAMGVKSPADKETTAAERYKALTNTADATELATLRTMFADLADIANYSKQIDVPEAVAIEAIQYQMNCEALAEELPIHNEIGKAELTHRYFKALKAAGAYAFIEGKRVVSMSNLHEAIKLMEDSGKAFSAIMTREKPYIKLAKYLAGSELETTHADLEELPFYTGLASVKKDMLMLAIAYGYKNNIIIKRLYSNGVEILVGESLKRTDIEEVTVSISDHQAFNYQNEIAPFKDIHQLTQAQGMHWVNHHTVDERRREESMKVGFNMVVIDVDGGIDINTAQLLLKDFTYHMYTTKRHTAEENRFRILIPISHTLKLDGDDYKEFMSNVYSFLPFESDEQTNQRCKKWLSHKGNYFDNEGELLDALQFIPKTERNLERQNNLDKQGDLTHLERWFAGKISQGNRSNELHKYARMLVDSGRDYIDIQEAVMVLNDKLKNKLPTQEIMDTILKTAAKAVKERE